MKKKFELIKKPHSYSIKSINNPMVKISTQILANKVMRKCRMDVVPAPMVSLAAQCTEGVQFNWSRYLSSDFLANCREAQDESKTFHYAWFLLSIMLVAWDLLEDNWFPPMEAKFLEATQFASLWATKNPV